MLVSLTSAVRAKGREGKVGGRRGREEKGEGGGKISCVDSMIMCLQNWERQGEEDISTNKHLANLEDTHSI